MAPLGFRTLGTGSRIVLILNDWLCDTTTWDAAHDYLDRAKFTWAFVDLRGYGRSIDLVGSYTLLEAADDVIKLAHANNWNRFTIVGHSMSALIALHLAQNRTDRIERVVILTPPPPAGFGANEAQLDGSRSFARGDHATRAGLLKQRFGDRLSPGWTTFKTERWFSTANPEAASGYVAMFARDGLPNPTVRIMVPVLAITGEKDAEVMRAESATRLLTPLCDSLAVVPLVDSGHYPMQEMPPLVVAHVERFVSAGAV